MGCFRDKKSSGKITNKSNRLTHDPVLPNGIVIISERPLPETAIDAYDYYNDRRDAVASTPVVINKDDKLRHVPKSIGDEEIIENALRKNEFLSIILCEDNIRKMINAMTLLHVKANEVIIKQGDKGSAIYISSQGTYQVIVNGKKVSEFTDNRVFGELAILYNAKRLSTIKSTTGGAIWCLDRNTYQLILTHTNLNKDEELFNFLQTVDKLNTTRPETLKVVANLLKDVFFESGSKIVKEGDPGDKFYIIRAGSVTVSKKFEGVVSTLEQGACFGELALQNEDIRQATVTANSPGVECLTLNRSDFQNYFGDIKITEIDVQRLKSFLEIQPGYVDVSLGDLNVLGVLGIGGFGRVELVQHKKRKDEVFALKRLSKARIVEEAKQTHVFSEKYIQVEQQIEVPDEATPGSSRDEENIQINENCSNVATQTELSRHDLCKLFEDCTNSNVRIYNLEQRLKNFELSEDSFKNNDNKTCYFTGLPKSEMMFILFGTLQEYIPVHSNTLLSPFEQFILTVMKLRLNLPFKFLAYQFNIAPCTASRIFYQCIDIFYDRLKGFVFWPTREELKRNIPECFKESFGDRVAVIIDCFEVFMETPSKLLHAAQCWSNYKHHETVKFLIGITPQGSISYISEAWGGRSSDKFISENCGFLNLILPNDIVLADRGFVIKDSVECLGASLEIPAFTKGKSQLHPIDLENTRNIATVRIHVERVIGLLRKKYRIFQGPLPMTMVSNITNNKSYLDKIAVVCSALVNLCPSQIPLS